MNNLCLLRKIAGRNLTESSTWRQQLVTFLLKLFFKDFFMLNAHRFLAASLGYCIVLHTAMYYLAAQYLTVL